MTHVPAPPPSNVPDAPKRLAPWKWALGVLCLIVVMVSCGGFGLFLRGGPPQAPATPPNPLASMVMSGVGLVLIVFGGLAYGLVLLTGCFTVNFTSPFFKGFGIKLWIANLLVGLMLQVGCSFLLMPVLYPTLLRLLPAQVAVMGAIFAPFIAAQLVMIWITIWGPVMTLAIRRRMAGRGISAEQMAYGRPIGISNPDRNSLRKLGLIEEDLGMLWIGDRSLVYWGDHDAMEIPHERLIAIERKADAGSTSAYFGAVHVILRFIGPDGVERRIRIHPEGEWTMTGTARSLNLIADRLTAWQEHPHAGWAVGQAAFAVEGHT